MNTKTEKVKNLSLKQKKVVEAIAKNMAEKG